MSFWTQLVPLPVFARASLRTGWLCRRSRHVLSSVLELQQDTAKSICCLSYFVQSSRGSSRVKQLYRISSLKQLCPSPAHGPSGCVPNTKRSQLALQVNKVKNEAYWPGVSVADAAVGLNCAKCRILRILFGHYWILNRHKQHCIWRA